MGRAATSKMNPGNIAPEGEVMDLVFEILGGTLPADYRHALRDAILRELPWLDDEPAAAIHPLKSSRSDDGTLLLSARTRLVLRVPAARLADASKLSGKALEMRASRITCGQSTKRALLAHGTVYAHLVSGDIDDEPGFTAAMRCELESLGIRGEVICGRRQTIGEGDCRLRGFSVMAHGLAPEASLLLQAHGTGKDMKLGCGIFVPHRSAAAVGG